MSEYIEITSESAGKANTLIIHTNLELTTGDSEFYESPSAMEEGSAVAQALAPIEGIANLRIEARDLVVEYDPDTPGHVIEAEIAAALKDFFL